MRRVVPWVVAVILAPFSALPLRVLAQTGPTTASSSAPDESKKDEAIAHFTKGVALMKEEQFDAALAEFMTASKLYPLKNARKNAARCLRTLGRFDEALMMWESFLKDFGGSLKPEDTDEANKEIADLKGKVGTIVINANVDGATVVIDGVDRGKTPLAGPVVVAIGTRVVRVAKEGYLPFEAKPIVAGKANVTVEATLQPLARSGRIRVIEESGKVLEVLIDGAVVGKTPTYEGTVAPGSHVVVLRGEGKLGTQPATATVVVDDTFVLRLKAEELKSSAQIVPDPPGATVTLDGVRLGNGVWEGALRTGSHKVDVSAEGYFRATKSFETHDDKREVVKVTLERDESSPFWSGGKTYPLAVALFGGGLFGASLGGNYESSCGATAECTARSRPIGFAAGARIGYDLASGFAIELTAGYAFVKMSVSRKTSLTGDFGLVPVAITDDVKVSGPLVGLGASFAFVRRPIVLSGALAAGALFARVRETRTGTVSADNPPQIRDLGTSAPDTPAKIAPFILPELRVAYPIGDRLQIGLGLGVLIAIGEVRPHVQQFPPASPSDPSGQATFNGKSIGFLPRGDDSATGTYFLGQAALFARLAF